MRTPTISRKTLRPALTIALLYGTTGCALLPGHTHWAHLTPVTTPTNLSPTDGYYAAATSAIERRDYATALDLLQEARARKADDIRVLNAFGVVYDKLGRFDLSARYYGQAKAIDENSAVVNNNLAYSQLMQKQFSTRDDRPTLAAASDTAAPQRPLQLASRQPGVIYLDIAAPKAVVMALPVATGHPIVVVDASGRKNGAEPVRAALAQLGWSTPRSLATVGPSTPRTTIQYPQAYQVAAQALARTLPAGPTMTVCDRICKGIRLVVGTDATSWKFSGRFAPQPQS